MNQHHDVIVVGGGAIGCSTAYFLRSEGLKVALVDKGEVGKEASWASAGIIGPGSLPEGEPWFLQATNLSKQLYDELNLTLFEQTGVWIGYGGQGTMILALSEKEADAAKIQAKQEIAGGLPVEILKGTEARQCESMLPDNLMAAILYPQSRFLDARNYTATIAKAAQGEGVTIRQGWPVTGMVWQGKQVVGVRSGPNQLLADWVINAAGTWAGHLDLKLTAPIIPDHGQIMSLQGPSTGLRHTLFRCNSYGYITPRIDGRMVVGATHEEIGFRKKLTASGLRYLVNIVQRVLPGLMDQPMIDIWSGLRPMTPDGLPIVGPDPRVKGGYLWAAGHSSSGMMQAPATAKVLTDLVLLKKPRIPINKVKIDRFQTDGIL